MGMDGGYYGSNSSDKPVDSSAALQALGMIVKVTTSNLSHDGKIQQRNSKFATELVIPLVDSMFKCGLSRVLIETLKVISENVDTARGTIQSRLFSEIEKILRSHTGMDDMLYGMSPGQRRPSVAQVRRRRW